MLPNNMIIGPKGNEQIGTQSYLGNNSGHSLIYSTVTDLARFLG